MPELESVATETLVDPLDDSPAQEAPASKEPPAAPVESAQAAEPQEGAQADAPEGQTDAAYQPDDGLLDTARSLRVSPDAIAKWKSEDDALNYLQQRAEVFAEFEAEQQRPAERSPTNGRAPSFNLPELKLPDEIDPQIAETLRSLHGYVQTIGGTFEQFIQMSQHAAEAQQQQRFDDALNSLPEEYAELVGKGRGTDLKKSSPSLYKSRGQIFSKFDKLFDPSSGESFEDQVLSAVHAAFPKKVAEISRRKVAGSVTKRSARITSAPTHRSAPVAMTDSQRIANIAAASERIYGKSAATPDPLSD